MNLSKTAYDCYIHLIFSYLYDAVYNVVYSRSVYTPRLKIFYRDAPSGAQRTLVK
jgi:hypothetical protein